MTGEESHGIRSIVRASGEHIEIMGVSAQYYRDLAISVEEELNLLLVAYCKKQSCVDQLFKELNGRGIMVDSIISSLPKDIRDGIEENRGTRIDIIEKNAKAAIMRRIQNGRIEK